MNKNHTQKPKNVDYFRVPRPLWRQMRSILPPEAAYKGPGRKRADNRRVIHGVWYVVDMRYERPRAELNRAACD